MAYISLDKVSKIYQMGDVEITALKEVSFDIEEGQFIVVLGASGAGKTTLLNILGGMDKASSGKIMIDGKDISEYNDNELTQYRRYDIGFVFQFYNLIQNLTAYENIELARQIARNPLNSADVLKMVSLTDRKDNFPSQLSGGEQQRIAIARAMVKNPKLLLCDEPTGALDYVTGKQILAVLQKMSKEKKMTVIMITHNSALAKMGEKIIHVHSGEIKKIENNPSPLNAMEIEY